MNTVRTGTYAAALTLVAGLGGCDDEQPGEATLRVSIYGESFVEDRVPADVMVDGWEVEFSTFLIAVGDLAADAEPLPGHQLFDLTVPSDAAGHPVAELLVPAGTSTHLDYRISPAVAFEGGNTTAQQQSMMAAGGYSVYVEGTARRDAETKTFAWGFWEDTRYTHCHIDRALGDGDTDDAEITIHADHLFYDDLDSDEPNVAFDIMARADVDEDGMVTDDELRALDITTESRYQVGSRPISDLWGFVAAQTTTVGHIDGEGHCVAQ